jgi:hypothetical protein
MNVILIFKRFITNDVASRSNSMYPDHKRIKKYFIILINNIVDIKSRREEMTFQNISVNLSKSTTPLPLLKKRSLQKK